MSKTSSAKHIRLDKALDAYRRRKWPEYTELTPVSPSQGPEPNPPEYTRRVEIDLISETEFTSEFAHPTAFNSLMAVTRDGEEIEMESWRACRTFSNEKRTDYVSYLPPCAHGLRGAFIEKVQFDDWLDRTCPPAFSILRSTSLPDASIELSVGHNANAQTRNMMLWRVYQQVCLGEFDGALWLYGGGKETEAAPITGDALVHGECFADYHQGIVSAIGSKGSFSHMLNEPFGGGITSIESHISAIYVGRERFDRFKAELSKGVLPAPAIAAAPAHESVPHRGLQSLAGDRRQAGSVTDNETDDETAGSGVFARACRAVANEKPRQRSKSVKALRRLAEIYYDQPPEKRYSEKIADRLHDCQIDIAWKTLKPLLTQVYKKMDQVEPS